MPTFGAHRNRALDGARIRAEARRLVREYGLAPHNAAAKATAKARRKGWYRT
jgi:hypothetical protein